MKRFFILASAAIVALASCAKTEVVYKDAPEEIAFKQITNVMTKADALGDQGHTDMKVSAFDESNNYLWVERFAKSSTANTWVATPAKYWPLSGSLNFVYSAPNSVNAVAAYVDGGYTLTADLTNDVDFLYGTTVKNASKTNDVIDVDLKHALAKICVSVTSDLAGLVITDLQLTNVYKNGKAKVDYKTSEISFDFTSASPAPISLFTAETLQKDVKIENSCYVMPNTQTSIVIGYKLSNESSPMEYTLNLSTVGNWESGFKYIYDFNIGANEIKFNPSVTDDWVTGVDEDETVVPTTPRS